ncbi:MAG: hypothetical protein AAF826_00275 [Pseudomonadota bacterium]
MTDNIQTTKAPKRMSDWENQEAHGKGRVCKKLYDSHVADVTELRQRHEAYFESLPKDREAALKAIQDLSKIEVSDIYEEYCAARLSFVAIYELADKIEEDILMTDLLKWLSRMGREAVDRLDANRQEIRDIAMQFHPEYMQYKA